MSESDLRSNVCFYRADPLFAALYGKEEEVRRYWEKLCAVNGIGCIADEDPHAYADFWRDVAFDSIDRDGWCPHPQCGEQQLISYRREYANSHARTVAYSGVYPSCNQAFPFLGFCKEAAEHASSALEDVCLDFWERETAHDDMPEWSLSEHPICYRSYATFPLIRKLDIIEGETKQIARNANGLTVADVMHFELDDELSAPSIKQLIHDIKYGTFDMQSVREDPGIVWQSFRLNLPAIIKEGMSRRQFFHIFRLCEFLICGDSVSDSEARTTFPGSIELVNFVCWLVTRDTLNKLFPSFHDLVSEGWSVATAKKKEISIIQSRVVLHEFVERLDARVREETRKDTTLHPSTA